MMNLRFLSSFLVLAEELHFGRAARRLHITQSALTKQIQQLECGLDGPLLERNTQKVTLSKGGQILVTEGHRLQKQLQAVETQVRSVFKGIQGILSIGYGDITEIRRLSPVIREMRRLYPNVDLKAEELHPGETLERVIAGELDAAIVTGLGDEKFSSDLIALKIMQGGIKLACSSSHMFASYPRVSPSELPGQPFIMVKEGQTDELPSVRHAINTWWKEIVKVEPNIVLQVRNRTTAYFLSGTGLGISLLPNCYELAPNTNNDLNSIVSNTIFIPVNELNINLGTFVVLKNSKQKIVTNFINLINKYYLVNPELRVHTTTML